MIDAAPVAGASQLRGRIRPNPSSAARQFAFDQELSVPMDAIALRSRYFSWLRARSGPRPAKRRIERKQTALGKR